MVIKILRTMKSALNTAQIKQLKMKKSAIEMRYLEIQ